MTSAKQRRAQAAFKRMVKVRAKKQRKGKIKKLRAELKRLIHKR
jgi:hypothetical protein